MVYLKFSLLFFVIHFICYMAAGVIDLQFAGKLYAGKERLYRHMMRDLDDKKESTRIARLLIPSQLIRALLMSVVLYPILPFLTGLSFGMQFLFMSSLMLVYADFSSAVPFSNTIEGWVYLKKEYVQKNAFWTILLESIMYSLLFGLLSAWILI